MLIQFTRKQRERINRAWHYAEDFASRTDLIAGRMLKDALRLERKDRSDMALCKGMLVNCLADNPTTRTIADLYTVGRGCQLAYILAAYWNGKPAWEEIRNIVAEGAFDYREGWRGGRK